MNRNEERERQWQETLEISAALKDRPAAEAGAVPSPGEIYLSRRTAGFPVEWLVIDAEDDGRLRLVPVDDYPLVGSRDVELPAPSLGGVAVARCGVDARAETSAFEPDLRTAVLAAADLERARSKRRAVEAEATEPTLLEEVADGDPDYQRWIEGTVQPAAEALAKKVKPERERPRRIAASARRWVPALVAVAAILALVLGLGGYVHRLAERLSEAQDRVAELERRGTEQSARIAEESRRRQASEREANRIESLLDTAKEQLAATGDQLAEVRRKLRQAVDIGAAVNVQKLVFGKDARFTRGGTRSQPVVHERGESPLTYLEVKVFDAEPYPTYRLRFEPTKGGKPLTVGGLDRDGAWLRLSLPADALEPGEYDVLIDGEGFGEPVELDERYRLTVEP